MQRKHEIGSGLERHTVPEGRRAQPSDIRQQRVDHRVADEEDAFAVDARGTQILTGELARGEEVVGDGVRHDSIDFLRHRPVAGAKPTLDVCDFHTHLACGNRTRQCGRDVAHHHTQRAALGTKQLLVANHDGRGLLRLRAGTDVEVHIRLRNAELRKKIAGHAGVVMLAGMNQTDTEWRRRRGALTTRLDDRRDLHEIRPCSRDDVEHWHTRPCHRASSAASIAMRLTSINSSNGIGAAPPFSIASTNAATHARWPLSCRQVLMRVKPGQPNAVSRPEIVELKDASADEYFEALFRETFVTGRDVVNRAGRAILEAQCDRRTVVRHRRVRCLAHRRDLNVAYRGAGEITQKIDEVTRLADDAPAADRGILRPVLGRDRSCVHGHDEHLRLLDAFEERSHFPHVGRETTVEADHQVAPRRFERTLDFGELVTREAQRLLHEHVLACLQSFSRRARRGCRGAW